MSDVANTIQELDNHAFFSLVRQELMRRKLGFLGAGWEMGKQDIGKTTVFLLAYVPTVLGSASTKEQFTAVGAFVEEALKQGATVNGAPDIDVEVPGDAAVQQT